MNANSTHYVVGVDFGTPPGRAVAVRVSDGAELGTAVHEYAHRVIEEPLPGSDVLPGPDRPHAWPEPRLYDRYQNVYGQRSHR